MLAIGAYLSRFILSRSLSGLFFPRRPCAVVTFAHHGVALPSIFATMAAVIGGASLARGLPLAATAFPMSVTGGSTTMAATCTMDRLLGANALPSIDIARTGMGTWLGWYIIFSRAVLISMDFARFLLKARFWVHLIVGDDTTTLNEHLSTWPPHKFC